MMTNNGLKIPKEQLAALRPGDVQSYLLSRGWLADREASPPRGTLFRHPSIPDAEALLPLDRDLGDYVYRMADIVLVVAAVENRSVWEVLNDLSGPPSDVLRLRVVASDATLGNLPLEEGIKLLRGGRDLLWAAAHGTLRPQALHPQHDLRPVQEFLSECRLGQTERGSFVATILAPVPPQFQSLLNLQYEEGGEESEPFARRVTTRLMSSLDFVRQSILTGEEKRILDGVSRGVSANFCDALLLMKPPGDQSQLDIRMNWARSRPIPGETIPQSVSFAKESFQAIEEVGRQLRRRATAQTERLTGKVVELRTAFRSLLDDVAGRIVLKTEVRGESAWVKVDLREDDYRRACDAHRDGHRVAVTGIIHYEARAKHFELSDPQAFEVLKES